jgi:hypothetical protein
MVYVDDIRNAITDVELRKLARRAVAHREAGVREIEISAVVFERMCWELLRLRIEAARLEISLQRAKRENMG